MLYVISGSMQKVKNIPSCLRFAFAAFGVGMQAFISDSWFIFTDGTVSVRTCFLSVLLLPVEKECTLLSSVFVCFIFLNIVAFLL